MMPFILAGLVTGVVYSLAGTGLVLTFKTSGVFNFGQGALATVSAYIFYAVQTQHGLPWGLAAFVSIAVAGPVMGLGMAVLARAVTNRSLAVNIGSTVGILLVVQAAVNLVYGTAATRTVPIFFGSGRVHLFGVAVHWFDVSTFIIGIAATAALTVYLATTRMGMAMRAVVDDAALLDTSGISPGRVRRAAWVIGSTLAAASGVLFAPLLPMDPLQLTLLVVAAFGAAAIGGFRSLSLTFVGGLVIGVGGSLLTRYLSTNSALSGLAQSLPFLVLFVLLIVYPKRSRLPEIAATTARVVAPWRAPLSLNLGLGTAVLIVLCLVPEFAGLHLSDWTTALATIVVFLSLGLLVRISGQVSLCQVSFMAIGAAAFSHLASGLHIPWVPALIIAGLIAMPIGALLAIPAIRLSGLYLALATFGFGILLEYVFYTQHYMFGYNGVGLTEPLPHLSWLTVDTDTGFYYVVLFCTLIAVGLLVAIDRSRMGRLLRGIADAPRAMQASGNSVTITRLLVFCLSAFLAAIGGALAGAAQSTVSASNYPPMLSLTYLAVMVVVAANAPWNALIAGFTFVLIPAYFSSLTVSYVLQIVFGAGLILHALQPESMNHLPSGVTNVIDRLFGRRKSGGRTAARGSGQMPERGEEGSRLGASVARVAECALELSEVRVQFGGLVAVRDASLIAPTGQITGLIGPNGAGKTTIFNVCSGFQFPQHGRVSMDGRNLTRVGPARRARLGLGRTFQQMELFDSLSVRENIMLGAEGRFAHGNPTSHLFAVPDQHRTSVMSSGAAIELCGLTDLAEEPVATLATGQRRLVDLARCLAGEPRILLLDEPSSGLDRAETHRFGDILRQVTAERGLGILIVEHDLSLVLDICRSIYVLDFGEILFHGTPEEVVASQVVQAAYLGEAPPQGREGAGLTIASSTQGSAN